MEERQIDCYLPDTGKNSEAAPLAEARQEALEAVHQERELTPPQWDALPKNTPGKFDKSAFVYDKENMGIRRFMRRGLEKVKTEWTMICTAVNLGILLRNWEEVVKVL